MSRLTDNDKKFWFITYGKTTWNPWRLIYSSGGGEESYQRNHIIFYLFSHVFRIPMPNLIKPYRIWHRFNEPVNGRIGYWESFPCEYGFCLYEGFLTLFYGPQTFSSEDTKSISWFLPWTQWHFHRKSFYGLKGEHLKSWIATDKTNNTKFSDYTEQRNFCDSHVPKVKFLIKDVDGEEVKVSTHIVEREWTFGEGHFKWLRFFKKNLIRRDLSIEFAKEVGPDKGSWKGGLCGTSIDLNPGELHSSGFKRFCEETHRSKNGSFKIELIKEIENV